VNAYLFDTDVISNIFKPRPSERLLEKLDLLDQGQQFISTVTIFEIVYGAAKSSRIEYHLKNLKDVLLPAVNIVAFDTKAAFVCGHIRAVLEKQGQGLSLADIQIAAIAIANELILITGNTGHFMRIEGLKIENWLTQES
jgi:tRNA(fMet)-specific endonuclease VapC